MGTTLMATRPADRHGKPITHIPKGIGDEIRDSSMHPWLKKPLSTAADIFFPPVQHLPISPMPMMAVRSKLLPGATFRKLPTEMEQGFITPKGRYIDIGTNIHEAALPKVVTPAPRPNVNPADYFPTRMGREQLLQVRLMGNPQMGYVNNVAAYSKMTPEQQAALAHWMAANKEHPAILTYWLNATKPIKTPTGGISIGDTGTPLSFMDFLRKVGAD